MPDRSIGDPLRESSKLGNFELQSPLLKSFIVILVATTILLLILAHGSAPVLQAIMDDQNSQEKALHAPRAEQN